MGTTLSNSPEESLVLRLEARKSFTFGVRFRDANGKPVDITGADIRFTAARVHADNEIATVFWVQAVLTESALGLARVDIQAADLALDPGSYPFALTVVNGGYSSVVAKGLVELQANVEVSAVGQTFMTGDPATTLDIVQRAHGDILVTQGEIFPPTAGSIPPGGSSGQALVKISNDSYDLVWTYATGGNPIPAETIPEGQVVTATGLDTWEWRVLPEPDLAAADLALQHALAAVNAANAAQNTATGASNSAAAAQAAADLAADKANLATQDVSNVEAAMLLAQQETTNAQIAASGAQVQAAAADTKADQAEAAAAAAAADAAAAAGVAGGKADVRIQDTEPAIELRLSTTLWIDTTGGENLPKRWNGAAWIVITDKTALDAADAAAAAHAAALAADAKADAAAAQALLAAEAAGNAQTSANGKNTVWYQDAAPAGDNHREGDTWFDTNDGNKIYRWNVTAVNWLPMQLGTNAIAALAITDALIANLDIGKATAGTLDVARLGAKSISVEKLLIGNATNLIPFFPATTVEPHTSLSSATIATFNDPDVTWCIRITGGVGVDGTLANVLQLRGGAGPEGRWPIEEGRSYRVAISLGRGGTFPVSVQHRAVVYWRNKDHTVISTNTIVLSVGSFNAATWSGGLVTAPAGATYASITIQKNYWSDSNSQLYVYDASMTLAMDGSLIVDGSLDAFLITSPNIRTSGGSTRLEMTTAGIFALKAGVTALELTPERLRVYDGGQIAGMHTGNSDTGTFIGPIYGDTAALLGYGLLVEDFDGLDLAHIRSGPSTAGTDNYVALSARGANSSLFLRSFGTGNASNGILSLRFPGTLGSAGRSLEIADDEKIIARFLSIGTELFQVSDATAGTVGLVRRTSDGRLMNAVSSARYKQDVEDHQVDTAAVLALRPRSWRSRSEVAEDPSTTNRYAGFIAEEVEETGLTEAVVYNSDGTPESLVDRALIAGVVAVLQEQQSRLDALDGGRPAARARTTLSASGQIRAIPEHVVVDTTPTERPDSQRNHEPDLR